MKTVEDKTKEYYKWIEDLNKIYSKDKLSKEDFANELAHMKIL